jgi:dTDP-4-dehydrorhamnose reductase
VARIALIGSNGQLGSDIERLWPESIAGGRGDELIALTHADLEVTDFEMARSVLQGIRPTAVINTAAYHRVDECEANADLAFRVNGIGVKNLAIICSELGATLMHFSTDYVFGGERGTPYQETDLTDPISAYGISKAAGELFLRYLLPENHILIRSSGLYGVAGASGKGGNFAETMLRLSRDRKPIRVVNDQRSCPTYTHDLALILLEILERGGRGTFHVTNSGDCSWYEFATAIFQMVGVEPDFAPTTSREFGAAAKRPAYSVLENARIRELGIPPLRPWQDALRHYLQAKGHLKSA